MVSRKILFFLVFLAFGLGNYAFGQCENWNDSPQKDQAEAAHSNYRSALKMNDFGLAYTEWQKAYEMAPAADGLRDFHYTDGIKIYKEQLKATTDEAKRKELIDKILELYDKAAYCYENGGITLKDCDADCHKVRAGHLLGRKGFDMFYEFNSPYGPNLEAFMQSLDKAGNEVEYILFEPVANIVVYQYKQNKMTAEEVRAIYERLVEAADYGIENSKDYSQYYESAKARMLAKFAEIESEIFDCEYFKSKLEPMYNEKPDDPDVVKYVYNKLIQEGCDKEDEFLKKLQSTYEEYAAEENARLQAEFEKNNPGVLANRLYKEGDFENAAIKYREALESEEDPDKRSQYYFNIASIEFRKLSKWQDARSDALKAAELRPKWGQPYLLIGDIYAQAAKSCGGDAWGQRIVILAALDKYIYARSIDDTVSEEADRKIGIYNSNRPSKDDAFMRGHKEGDVLNTGCWIGEQTKLRVQ
ncbi:MAG: hypothetical protein KDC53_10975 [Saprospiraceae bacterium]|nr:hypothetical protein [Saprospiraceae bacterium]